MSALSAAPRRTATQTIRAGLRLSPEFREGLGATLALALLAVAGRAIVPVAIQQSIDKGFDGSTVDMGAIGIAVSIAGVAVVVTAIAGSLSNIRLARATETSLSNLRVRAFAHIHDLSMLHQAAEARGSLVARVTTDIDEISRFFQWAGLNLLSGIGVVLVATVFMAVYSWQLTLVVIAVFIPFGFIARYFQQQLMDKYVVVRQRMATLLGVVAEAVVGAPVIRAYGDRVRAQERVDAAIEGHRVMAARVGGWSAGFSSVGEITGAIAIAAVLVVGTILAVNGDLSAGTVVAFPFLISMFVDPVLLIGEALGEAQGAVAGWQRVLDVLDVPPDVADPEEGVDLPAGPISVAFDHVTFRYPRPGETGATATGPIVLHDVTIEIPANTNVAVVGETGSGKTTLAKLLCRLMDPVSGQVLLSGTPIDTVRFANLRRRVVLVAQEGALLDGTVADNVRMGKPEADEADLELAFTELGLADWLEELPDGLATDVGERGDGLSAGERQLVALARAYIANPDLLVLDEATSAVDPATDVRLQSAVAGLTRGRTTVTVAHRLSTAEAADLVLVIDDGRLVQVGSHDELVAQSGVYARLHASWRTGTSA
ncbi:MAG: ABC transporter ATP-binding protein [Nitriliruptorales bacterium]|nr:ABC transporter ATP-binding protein [Nitriliruptorales bacterium]